MASTVKSCECTNTSLDIFAVSPTQTSIENGLYVEYHPLATLTDSGPIEFIVKGSDDYLDLTNSYLHVQAKITKADGSPLDAADDNLVAPVNNWLHTLFSQVDISLNNTNISTSTNTYGYRSFLETMLNYGKDCKDTQMGLSMYYEGHGADFPYTTDDKNVALQARRSRTKRSKDVDMIGRIHADLFTQDKLLLDNVSLRMRFVRSKDSFALLALAPAGDGEGQEVEKYRVKITHASFFVRKVKVNPAIVLAQAKALQTATAKYPVKRVVLKVFSVPKSNLNIVQDNIFLTQKPNRLVIALVDSRAFNGDYKLSPFEFKHFDINTLALHVDGFQVDFKPNFKTDCYARSYFSLFAATGTSWKDFGNTIGYEDYKLGKSLFCFDLTPSLAGGDMIEIPKATNIRLEIGFSQPLPEPAHIIVYGELDGMIEIDRSRQIITDFTT